MMRDERRLAGKLLERLRMMNVMQFQNRMGKFGFLSHNRRADLECKWTSIVGDEFINDVEGTWDMNMYWIVNMIYFELLIP